MKKIYFEIENQYRNTELEWLMAELQEKGIEVHQLSQVQGQEGWKGMAEQALVLTDRQETADRAAEWNMACVGYEPPGAGVRLSRVDIVIQGFEELNAEFFHLTYRRHHGLPWTIAETERLLLRESVAEDFDELYAFYQEPGMADYMPGMERGKEEERDLFEAYIRRMYPFFSYGLWTVLEKDSGRVIGRAGLENGTYQGEPVLEVGYMLGRKYQHRGYGIEAVQAITDYGFAAVGAEAVYAFIHEENEKSLKLIQRAGFRQIPCDKEGILVFVKRM